MLKIEKLPVTQELLLTYNGKKITTIPMEVKISERSYVQLSVEEIINALKEVQNEIC